MNRQIAAFAFAVFSILSSSSALAQRVVPGNAGDGYYGGDAFVIQADAGAQCATCDVFLLRDAYPAPAHINVYGPKVDAQYKPTADILIYDRATGNAFFVKTSPQGYVSPYAAMGIFESAQAMRLPYNLTLTIGDLDGDGRDDILAHSKTTGQILRIYRRDVSQ